MRQFNFYKDIDFRWYVDLPEWKGCKSDLEMVCGADSMLEYMCEGSNVVEAFLSETKFNNADQLDFIRIADEIGNGAFYFLKNYRGIDIGLTIWLCDVTLFVFGYFPKTIYISKIEN